MWWKPLLLSLLWPRVFRQYNSIGRSEGTTSKRVVCPIRLGTCSIKRVLTGCTDREVHFVDCLSAAECPDDRNRRAGYLLLFAFKANRVALRLSYFLISFAVLRWSCVPTEGGCSKPWDPKCPQMMNRICRQLPWKEYNACSVQPVDCSGF